MVRQLTARGVKTMLTRAGVDYSGLQIVDDPTVWTDLETGRQGTSVIISGPEAARWAAHTALFWGHGLSSNAPYPDHDRWVRR
jgi:hypothetical protein